VKEVERSTSMDVAVRRGGRGQVCASILQTANRERDARACGGQSVTKWLPCWRSGTGRAKSRVDRSCRILLVYFPLKFIHDVMIIAILIENSTPYWYSRASSGSRLQKIQITIPGREYSVCRLYFGEYSQLASRGSQHLAIYST